MATVLTEVAGFQLANIVLSQKKSFTFDELFSQVQGTGMEANEMTLRRSLNRFCDNGILIKHGSFYSVSLSDI